MSLESYRKYLKDQEAKNDEPIGSDDASQVADEQVTERVEYVYVERKSGRKGIVWLCAFILIVALLTVAAVKNPTDTEAKEMANKFIVEKVDKFFVDKMNDEDAGGFQQLAAFFGLSFSSKLVNSFVETKVNNYVVMSTFDSEVEMDNSKKTIMSGVIVFGKLIPLSTDLDLDDVSNLGKSEK